MAYYKLVPQNRSDSIVDEVIFLDSESGEKKSVTVDQGTELSDAEVGTLRDQGYTLVETSEPQESESSQPVGSDVAGMSPVVGESVTGEPKLSQQGMQSAVRDRGEHDQTS